MAIPVNDNQIGFHGKPSHEYEKKNVGGAYVDWDSIAELNDAVNINFRRNKIFQVDGNTYRCEDDGVTYSLIGGKDTLWDTTDNFFDLV